MLIKKNASQEDIEHFREYLTELLSELRLSNPKKYDAILEEYRNELEAINFIPARKV